MHACWQPPAAIIAAFVEEHDLRRVVMGLLSGETDWPELRGLRYGTWGLGKSLLPVCETVLTKHDARHLEALLSQRDPSAVTYRWADGQLALLAAKLDPDRAEEIVLSQLARTPGRWRLAVWLLSNGGAKHWDLVRKLYLGYPPDSKVQVIKGLGQMGPAGKPLLREIFVPDDLSATFDPSGHPTQHSWRRQRLFLAFVEAAQAANGGRPVLSDELRQRARLPGKVRQEDRPSHLQIAAARQQALQQIEQFLHSP